MTSPNDQDSSDSAVTDRPAPHDLSSVMVGVVILAMVIITILTITAIWQGAPAI